MARLIKSSDSDRVAFFLKKTARPKLTVRLTPNSPDMEQEFVFAVADELRNSISPRKSGAPVRPERIDW